MHQTAIFIVRHGQSTANAAGIAAGQSDPPLSDEGRRQAEETKAALKSIHFDEIYTSNLQRAIDTARIISGKEVPETHQLVMLQERDFGQLEGHPMAEMHEAHERMLGLPANEQRQSRLAPGAENDEEVAERFIGALRNIGRDNPGKTVLVVAHGGTLRVLLVELGFGTMAELPPGSFGNAGFVELTYQDGRLLIKRTVGVTKRRTDAAA